MTMKNNIFNGILVFVLMITFKSFSQEKELVKKDWPNIFDKFGKDIDKKPLNFIFVLDISDKTFGNDIKRVVKDFLKPVKAGDYFNVILLGSTDKTSNLTECAIVDDSKKNRIISQIDNQVFGTTGSDGVKMTSLVIDAINCAGAKDATPVVFIFSDFVHYNNGWSVPEDKFWKPLANKYNQLNKESSYVYCIELPNVDKKPQYLNKLRTVFTNANTVTCSDPKLLDDKFNNIKAKLIKSLLKDIVVRKVEDEKNNIVLDYQDNSVVLKDFDKLVYSKVILDNESSKKVNEIVINKALYSFTPPVSKNIEVSGFLIAEKYKNELPELNDIELKNHTISILESDSKIPWWLTDVIVLIILLSILRFIWFLIPSKLDGMITFSSTENFEASQNNFNAKGKITVNIGYGKEYANDSKLFSSEDFSLKIKAKKHIIKGKCIELSPLNGDLRSRNGKITIQRGTSILVDKISSWNINGVTIGLPNVK